MNSFKNRLCLDINGTLSLEETLFCGQCFRWQKNENGFYSGIVHGIYLFAAVQNGKLCLYSDFPLDGEYWRRYFALDEDYPAYHAALCKNETLKKCVEYAPGIRVLHQDFFETLITFIISQNNNIPRITKITQSLCENFGNKIGEGLYSFPDEKTLAALSPEDLAPIKAGFRAKYIIDAAVHTACGDVSFNSLCSACAADAAEMLKTIKGVGPKVADCVLLFSAGKKEAFPKDVWINRAVDRLFGGTVPPEAAGIEGIAQQYIFQYARSFL